ncbi:MAG: zeta toxin family protein [Cyclobacteriaceae bacterium]|jgi:predicted ABC-type ATPase
MPTLYIIAGCNGAGKTTASNTILPTILNCKEFINADSIAAGLSPFDAEKYAFEAGRLMLRRIDQMIREKADFAIETTLSSRNYLSKVSNAKLVGYRVVILFFWLNNKSLAIRRVKNRVSNGGHSIPIDVIKRRYERGLRNFFDLYIPKSDYWSFFDNSNGIVELIADGEGILTRNIIDNLIWKKVQVRSKRNIN